MFQAGHPASLSDPNVQRTRDHKIPVMMGEKALKPGNIKYVCRACNEIKGSHPYEIFAFYMRNAKPMPAARAKMAMNQFVYNLAMVGLIVCKQDAMARRGVPQEPFEHIGRRAGASISAIFARVLASKE
jgi:hypothetical protein